MKIRAYPTRYRGRQYRSRLEARWAAFFDKIGWAFEYEPGDLGSWSPDFLIIGENQRVLIEVKPITEFDPSVARKMAKALGNSEGPYDHEEDSGAGDTWLLLVGLSPQIVQCGPGGMNRRVRLGWAAHAKGGKADWHTADVCWIPDFDRPGFNPDIRVAANERDDWFAILNADGGPYCDREEEYCDHTAELWAKATNAVQWRGKGVEP